MNGENNLKILLVSPEVAPFAKTGGLADVAGSLPKALAKLGCDIRVVLPFYRAVEEGGFTLNKIHGELIVSTGPLKFSAEIYITTLNDQIPVYLIKEEALFDRRNLYGTPRRDYADNLIRFSFFSQAILTLMKFLDLKIDVIHCNDWQTGLVPCYLRTKLNDDPFFNSVAILFTIHNIGYQGIFSREQFLFTNLPGAVFTINGIEFYGQINCLKSGIIYSDIINTVSRKYSLEIQTPEFGNGLEGVLQYRASDLYGVLNGVDYDVWNPETDPFIPAKYSHHNLKGKSICRDELIKEFNLEPVDAKTPIIGMISRLTDQKGFDILAEAMDSLMKMDLRLVILGTGDEIYNKKYAELAAKYPGKLGVRIGFDNPLAHKIEAGSDMFLMPSRYEPGGLNQLYSLKYGTIPIVRATGGLDDTIVHYNPRTMAGNGFKFEEYSPKAIVKAVSEATKIFSDKVAWKRLMKNAMECDFSWNTSAKKYLELYHRAIDKHRRAG